MYRMPQPFCTQQLFRDAIAQWTTQHGHTQYVANSLDESFGATVQLTVFGGYFFQRMRGGEDVLTNSH